MKIYHTVNIWGTSDRHLRAMENWEQFYAQGMIPAHTTQSGLRRSFHSGMRKLPFLKDILRKGLEMASEDLDIIVWTNDDISFGPEIMEWCAKSVQADAAVSMRRNEEDHMGRDLFAFTKQWLKREFDDIPDFVQGVPYFDLALAAKIRKYHGIQTTYDNLKDDIWPAETHHRLALHEPHPPSWRGGGAVNLRNKQLANEWFSRNRREILL